MRATRYILYAIALIIIALIIGTIIMDIKTGKPIPKTIEGFAEDIVRLIQILAGRV
jgi:hypothetical protein